MLDCDSSFQAIYTHVAPAQRPVRAYHTVVAELSGRFLLGNTIRGCGTPQPPFKQQNSHVQREKENQTPTDS
jgi:hypothetical protein